MNAYAYLSLVAIAVNLVTGVYVLSRGPKLRLNRLVFAILMTLVVWASGEFIMRTAGTAQAALRGSRIAGLGWCLLGPVYLVFVLAYTEKEELLANPLTYLVLFLPGAFFLVMLWATDLIFKGFTPSYWGYREIGGALRIPSQFYVAIMMVAGIVLLIQNWRHDQSHRKRLDTGYILLVSMIPLGAGLVTDMILPLLDIHMVELTMFASAVIGPVLGYVIVSRGFLTTITGSLGSTIITKIREAIFVTDSEGLIETVNPAAEVLTAYSAAALLGTPVERLFTNEAEGARGLEPAVQRHAWTYCVSSLGELIPVTVSKEVIRRRAGGVVGSVVLLRDLRDTLRLIEAERETELATAEVVSERERSENLRRSREELRQLSSFLENVIENIAEPVYIRDRDYRLVFVNKAFRELSGLSRERDLENPGREMAARGKADASRQHDASVFATGRLLRRDETILNQRDGTLRKVKAIRAPLKNHAGEVEHVVGIFSDVTEQKRLDDARLDFIRVAAHELRTPLTSLKLGFDMLARETRGALDKEQQRSLDVLSLSIERLSSLAKNLLDLAGMDAGLLTLNMQPVEIGPVVDEAVSLFSSAVEKKGLYCDVALDGNLRPASVDAGRLSQVLYNLISNAVKYTEEGGITISARDPGDGFLEICVADTGVGISAAQHDSIFTSFVKARSTEAGREGTGLGLSITKAIVEAHGGRIRVQSAPGEGSKFYFTVQAFD